MASVLVSPELVLLTGVFGLVIGSFLNVVIYRVPNSESLLGRSHCPGCDQQIAAYDNIPVLSWLVLRGRCRTCRKRISAQYPLVELATGLLYAAVAAKFGLSVLTLTLLVFAAVSVALFMIDLQTLRLPDVIVGPATLVVGLGLLISGIVDESGSNLVVMGSAAAALGTAYFSLWFITGGRGLGFGDVKVAPLLGATLGYFGWGSLVVGTAAAWGIGALVGITALLLGKVKRGKPIPFGPFLIVGAWVGVFFGQDIWQRYLDMTGLAG